MFGWKEIDMKRPLSLAVFLLCFSVSLAAQTGGKVLIPPRLTGVAATGPIPRSGPIVGVVLQSYDQPASGSFGESTPGQPTSGSCVGHLVNMSHKYVTAVDIGVSKPGRNDPFNEATFQWDNDAFAPGATKDLFFGPCDESVKVVLDVAVYDDLTAESLNDRALQSIIESRQRGLMTQQKINEVISKSASPQEAATELEKLADAIPRERHEHVLDLYSVPLRTTAEALRAGVDPQEIVKRNTESINKHQRDSEIIKTN